MISIKNNLKKIYERICTIAIRCGRSPEEITLLAVSKTKPIKMLIEAILAGQHIFGENYVQEGVKKITELTRYPHLQWHFIGTLQSNKSRLVAEHFSWCHTIDRLHIAKRLNIQRPQHLPPLNVLIEINLNKKHSGFNIHLDDLFELSQQIAVMPNLRLRGLTAILLPEQNYQSQLSACQQIADMFNVLKQQYPNVDTLSMGMSNDLDAAITAGSTLVRIGTAIFGERFHKPIFTK